MPVLTRRGHHICTIALRQYPGPWPYAPVVPTGDLVVTGGMVTLNATAMIAGVEYGALPASGWVWQSADQRCIGLNGLIVNAALVAVLVSGAPVQGTTIARVMASTPAWCSIGQPDTGA